MSKKFAELDPDGRVLAVRELPFDEAPNEYCIDVDDWAVDTPTIGQMYDPVSNTFSDASPLETSAPVQDVFSIRGFRKLFGMPKLIEIQAACNTTPAVKVFWDHAHLGDVSLSDPDTQMGLGMLVTENLITEEQKDTLLSGQSIA